MRRLAVSFVVAFVVVLSPRVIAQLKPPGDCTAELHRAMQDRVNAACKSAPMSCKGNQSCDELRVNWYRLQDCARARFDINQRCFRGGDAGHLKALEDIINGKNICESLLAQKNCPKACP